jgi:vacuolar-type H+-ATPase subunit I/STV1
MKYIKGFKLFKEQTEPTKSMEVNNQKVALEKRWNDYKSKKSQIPTRVDNFLKTGDMQSITLQKDDLSKSPFKDLVTNGSDQTVNEFIMSYLLFIIEQRKKWQDTSEKIKKTETEIKTLSDSKPTEKEEIDENQKKIKGLQDQLSTYRQLQNNYNKSVMDKEKELENIYNQEKKELETEFSVSKNLDKAVEAEKNTTQS